MGTGKTYASNKHPLLTEEFEQETDRLTGTRIRSGNQVTLLSTGARSYQKRWELLEGAKHNIHIVTFSVMRDDITRRLSNTVKKKLGQGIPVRFILDDLILYTTFSGGIVRDMANAGMQLIPYNKAFQNLMPDWRSSHRIHQVVRALKFKQKRRFHEKYLVIDGREAILGGMNWGGKYAYGGVRPKAWRDTDVHLTGPVVSDIQRQFIRDMFLYTVMHQDGTRRPPGCTPSAHIQKARELEKDFIQDQGPAVLPPLDATGDSRIRYLAHKPYDENRLRITEALVLMINRAQDHIFWGCHGIRPPRVIAETLASAVKRRVEVRLLTNNRQAARTLVAFGIFGWMHWESSNHYRWLVERGVRVFEWQRPGAFHSKALVIDGVVSSVGSFNIARGSTFHHTESNVIVYGEEFAREVAAQFDRDFKDCKEIRLSDTHRVRRRHDPFLRPLHERNLLIDRSLMTKEILEELDRGKYKRM